MTTKFLEGYGGQSTAQIVEMAREYRVDSLVLALEQALDAKGEDGSTTLNVAERTVLAIEALEREVNNGGYSQFFYNGSNAYASEVVAALERINCPATARVTQKAIDLLGIEGIPTVERIEEVIAVEDDAREDAHNRLDAEYYESGEDIAGRLFDFVKANVGEIRLP